jgi:hypothetical protein
METIKTGTISSAFLFVACSLLSTTNRNTGKPVSSASPRFAVSPYLRVALSLGLFPHSTLDTRHLALLDPDEGHFEILLYSGLVVVSPQFVGPLIVGKGIGRPRIAGPA